MTLAGASSSATPASILVVDDDRRVVELLTIALNAYGYRVIQANDGEEALRLASRERPDLVVLDVRLPKRSGYEVCELLRQDPEDPQIPIIMVSAAAETEARLQGLSRGADDYVAKPFSPKELIARIRRLLTRSAESRDARRRGREAEHELGPAREEAKRNHEELRGQQRLRDLTHGFVRDFHASLDGEALSRRLLIEAQAQLGSAMVALLGPDDADDGLRPVAFRGDAPERVQRLRILHGSELAALLTGLGRPVRHRDLQRFPGLRAELQPFVAAGIAVFAPLRGPDGLMGVVVADERFDGGEMEAAHLESLAVLCDTASLALWNAGRAALQAEGLLDALDTMAAGDGVPGSAAARSEAAALVASSAEALPPVTRQRVGLAIRVADWAASAAGQQTLAAMVARDSSGRVSSLARLLLLARDTDATWIDDQDPDLDAAVALVRVGLAYAAGRGRELPPDAALHAALDQGGAWLDTPLLDGLRAQIAPGGDAPTSFRSR